ncbi:hypothetical protein [Brevibacillus laterosporus]|uniref:hypothetical protein n=1 Tax=Brevibacillus laterosporus TaxID=1465 RepID=UPI001127E780|nr:hypothetical protein [Brevibacillus laterosporus]MED4763639.1 hypothetical protein [Brevibacillus laterosporus]
MKRKSSKPIIQQVQYDGYMNPYHDPYYLFDPYSPRRPDRREMCIREWRRCERRCHHRMGHDNVRCNRRCHREFQDCLGFHHRR